MTRLWLMLGLALLVLVGVATITLSNKPVTEPQLETDCDSCTARHKDKERLREFLKSKNEDAE